MNQLNSLDRGQSPPQDASDKHKKYRSNAEHCRPCTRLSAMN